MTAPRRVVSLASSNTEIVAALGLGAHLVGCDSNSDWPPEIVAALPRLGPDLEIDLDAVARLEPDLVLASLSVPGMERVVAGLRNRGLPHVALDPTSWADVLEDIRVVGRLLGVPDRGEAVAAAMESRAAALRAGLPRWPRPPRVMVEWWPRPVIAAARDSWLTGMLEALGAENAFSHLAQRSARVELAEAVRAAPDLISCSWCGVRRVRPELIERRSGWAEVPAVRRRAVVCIPESGLGRPGPRLLEGLTALAGALGGLDIQPPAGR